MIYLDNHATTPLDPAALSAMLPLMQEHFANAGSITHLYGRQVAQQVECSIQKVASNLGATADELVITSGATESNNLALMGVMHHPRQRRRKIVSVVTEHKAILDPLARLAQQGYEVIRVPVCRQQDNSSGFSDAESVVGLVDLQQLEDNIDESTALVSVMLANNEIGVIQPISAIAQLCRKHGALLHTDASQALGRIPINVDLLDVDLLSFSAHKFYGPKGVGGLFVRRRDRRVRLQGQIVGGGQQNNWRAGTLNTAGIVGMQVALDNTLANLQSDNERIGQLRDYLFERLKEVPQMFMNGPPLKHEYRLAGNLNCCFYPIEGQSLMLGCPKLAVSSGSACTSNNPEPSHVLRAIGLDEDKSRSSIRFGIGRMNSRTDIEQAAEMLVAAARELHQLL
jgi:cysteine desulfurase